LFFSDLVNSSWRGEDLEIATVFDDVFVMLTVCGEISVALTNKIGAVFIIFSIDQ